MQPPLMQERDWARSWLWQQTTQQFKRLEEEKAQLTCHLPLVPSSNQKGDEVHRCNTTARWRARRQGRALSAISATSHITSTETLQHQPSPDHGAAQAGLRSTDRPVTVPGGRVDRSAAHIRPTSPGLAPERDRLMRARLSAQVVLTSQASSQSRIYHCLLQSKVVGILTLVRGK